jgi:hypothetical protein
LTAKFMKENKIVEKIAKINICIGFLTTVSDMICTF